MTIVPPAASDAQPPSLYYSDESVELWHGDSRAVLADMADQSVDCVITDPPFSANTHENFRSNSQSAKAHGNRVLSGNFGFDFFTDDMLRESFATMGRLTRGWVVSSLDYKHAFLFDQTPPAGLRLLRIGVWVKPAPLPQVSGDRPGQGWEAITFLHRDDLRPSWNGGGRAATWILNPPRDGAHPTGKPLGMVADWVRMFTNPGDTILDPFAGSGTTLRAAKDEGRKAIGIEISEAYCETAAKRLAQDTLFGGVA